MAKEKSKKSKVLTSVAAVVLAASMLIGGGTYAYLQGETEDVVNSFKTNEVTVDLTETTGNDYNIIPGTTEDKDPKVTVNATVDAYVFVEVTDATEGLVEYTIADGWTTLEGYDNVYYREVSASEAEQEFYVLADNTVTYDAALTNTDMVDAEGNLKDGIDLTFKAYAIQKAPFNDPVAAFAGKDAQFVDDDTTYKEAVEAGGSVVLGKDAVIDVPEQIDSKYDGYLVAQTTITKDTVIDLNGKNVTLDQTDASLAYYPIITSVNGGTTVFNGNGTVNAELGYNSAYAIDVYGGNVVINGGNFYGAPSAIQVEKGSLTINGGFFDLAATVKKDAPDMAHYVVNCIDSAYKNGTATITITGGTFVNFDPSANPEGAGTSYVAEGYTVESEVQSNGDTWYTVVPAAV